MSLSERGLEGMAREIAAANHLPIASADSADGGELLRFVSQDARMGDQLLEELIGN